jgi:hypothetical protein
MAQPVHYEVHAHSCFLPDSLAWVYQYFYDAETAFGRLASFVCQ